MFFHTTTKLWPTRLVSSSTFNTFKVTICGGVVRVVASHQCHLGLISRHTWVECVVGSRPFSEGFLCILWFHPFTKTTIQVLILTSQVQVLTSLACKVHCGFCGGMKTRECRENQQNNALPCDVGKQITLTFYRQY